MIIREIVNLAKYSELSGLAIKENIEAIVAFINLGMLEIYSRFPIKLEDYTIALDANVTNYEMPANFMYATHAYLKAPQGSTASDTTLSINDDEDPIGICFSDWNTVRVSDPSIGEFIVVSHVTKPVSITVAEANDGSSTLDLPDTLVDALLSYVGYRGYLGVRADGQSENNAQWLRFERNCKKALENGVAFSSESLSMSTRIASRGFA